MEFIKGNWYQIKSIHDNRTLICYQGNSDGYGFNAHGDWVVYTSWNFALSLWEKVEYDYVKERLLKHANDHYYKGIKHTGYPGGKFRNRQFPFERKFTVVVKFSFIVKNELVMRYDRIIAEDQTGAIYAHGQWAEIEYNTELNSSGEEIKKESKSFVDKVVQINHNIDSKAINNGTDLIITNTRIVCHKKRKKKLKI